MKCNTPSLRKSVPLKAYVCWCNVYHVARLLCGTRLLADNDLCTPFDPPKQSLQVIITYQGT